MAQLKTSAGQIDYLLKRSSARRTISICIDEKGDVSVSAPMRASRKDIEQFIHQKSRWIVEKSFEAKKNQEYIFSKDYRDGQIFLFMGKPFPLRVTCGDVRRSRISFDESGWKVTLPMNLSRTEQKKRVKDKMLKWYRAQAEEVIGGRVFHYGRIMDLYPKRMAIRTQKRMWGCCDYNTQTIHFNWQIILSPLKVIDYVVVHEMCHLTIPNHSRRFWAKVKKFMPDFEEYRKWLKVNFLDMVLP